MARYELQIVSGSPINFHGTSSQVTKGKPLLNDSSSGKKDSILEEENKLQDSFDEINTSNGSFHDQASLVLEKRNQRVNGANNGSICNQATTPSETDDSQLRSDLGTDINPLNSQLPPSNVFSRQVMSSFFKSRKISPSTFSNTRSRSKVLRVSREDYNSTAQRSEGIGMDSVSGLMDIRSSNRSSLIKDLSVGHQRISIDCASEGDATDVSFTIMDKFGDRERRPMTANGSSTGVIGNSIDKRDVSETSVQHQKKNGGFPVFPEDDGVELVEGDMCASATGVVRVQSRKKAEMFLVRTDGFSCTREKVTESSLAFTHPSTQQQMLMWKSTPKTVLLLKKLGRELMEEAKEVASFLYYQEKMNVLVEPDVHDIFARIPGFGFVQTFYSQDTSDLHEKVDLVACLGGDGVILHASNLFRGPVPPVVSFNLGSLGFLTSHNFDCYDQDLRQVIHGNNTRDGVYITLRMRLRCQVFRNGKAMAGKIFDVLNEVVVDRGSNPYLSKIECYEHDHLITKVQGDGVIIATPTGSTAYSTAAGGSMVHPNVPCMLFTPICPHSLSFRPVILPDSARLELKRPEWRVLLKQIPGDARSNAWVSFDGKRRQQLSRGDSVRISMSRHPLPTVNKSDQTGDWFHSLVRCLNWNERLDQKAL
ncbi:hypothetical protein Ancab_037441 [Ancistrocladus abbreviatus]